MIRSFVLSLTNEKRYSIIYFWPRLIIQLEIRTSFLVSCLVTLETIFYLSILIIPLGFYYGPIFVIFPFLTTYAIYCNLRLALKFLFFLLIFPNFLFEFTVLFIYFSSPLLNLLFVVFLLLFP